MKRRTKRWVTALAAATVALVIVYASRRPWAGSAAADTVVSAADTTPPSARTPTVDTTASPPRERPLIVPSDPLPAGTELRVFGAAQAQAVESAAVPPARNPTGDILVDGGTSGRSYRSDSAFFVVARTADGGLFWTQDASGRPEYTDADSLQLASVEPGSVAAARLGSLFGTAGSAGAALPVSSSPGVGTILFALTAMLGAGAGFWLIARRHSDASEALAMDHVGLGKSIADLGRRLDDLSRSLVELHTRVGALAAVRTHQPTPPVERETPPPPSREPDQQPSRVQVGQISHGRAVTPADLIAEAFVEWCTSSSVGMLSDVQGFESHLRTALPGASVAPLPRNMAIPSKVTFDEAAEQRKDYWRVTVEGESYILPRPVSMQQFADLAPVYAGSATPSTLGGIRPARIYAEGSHWRLGNEGALERSSAPGERA